MPFWVLSILRVAAGQGSWIAKATRKQTETYAGQSALARVKCFELYREMLSEQLALHDILSGKEAHVTVSPSPQNCPWQLSHQATQAFSNEWTFPAVVQLLVAGLMEVDKIFLFGGTIQPSQSKSQNCTLFNPPFNPRSLTGGRRRAVEAAWGSKCHLLCNSYHEYDDF